MIMVRIDKKIKNKKILHIRAIATDGPHIVFSKSSGSSGNLTETVFLYDAHSILNEKATGVDLEEMRKGKEKTKKLEL